MRTTITLDPDTQALVRRTMREHGVSFKRAVNDAIRAGLTRRAGPGAAFRTRTAQLGMPVVNLDRALQVVAEMEDEELIRKSRLGK